MPVLLGPIINTLMLKTNFQLHPQQHISMKFYLKFIYFHSNKFIWNRHQQMSTILFRLQYICYQNSRYQLHCIPLVIRDTRHQTGGNNYTPIVDIFQLTKNDKETFACSNDWNINAETGGSTIISDDNPHCIIIVFNFHRLQCLLYNIQL